MSVMYDHYARNITRTSPFVWAHRLEVPLVLGAVAIVISYALGVAVGSALAGRVRPPPPSLDTADLIRAGFFVLTFFCGLATLAWLVLLCRTIDLRYSLKASRYPIYTVLVAGAVAINAAPFVFANVAEVQASLTGGWKLFDRSLTDDVWGEVGLMFFLPLISMAVTFALLIRRSSFHVPFSAFFVYISILLGATLYVVVSRSGGGTFVACCAIAWIIVGSCGFAIFRGKSWRHQDVILGTMLFVFSPVSIFLVYFVGVESGVFPMIGHLEGSSRPRASETSFWGVVFLFVIGAGLSELALLLIRKTRRYG